MKWGGGRKARRIADRGRQPCGGNHIQTAQCAQVLHQRKQRPCRYLRPQVSVNTMPPLLTQKHRFDALLQHDLLRRLSKGLIGKPSPVRLCPARPVAGVNPLVTQQKCTQLLAGRPHRTHRRQTGADQVAHRLVRRIRHPNRSQQSASVQHRQAGSVALVILLPLTAFTRDHRGRHHHAIFTGPGEGAMNAVAAGTGFIAELDRPAAGLPQTLDQFLQHCGGVGECAIGCGLANLPGRCDRDDDRLFVHIHADKSCRLFHDPSSCA